MSVMLERWNDDKMDALDAKVGGLGRRMETGFERVDIELREQRREMGELRKETKAGFDRLQSTMFRASVLIITALIGAPHL